VCMGWLQLVGSINYRPLLQKRPIKETLFCKRDLYLIDPTDRSHPICSCTNGRHILCDLIAHWNGFSHYSTLQHTATNHITVQHSHWVAMNASELIALQHTATCCKTLQYTAPHCNTLQHAATHCNKLQHISQHTASHCNTLHHTATHRNTLQHAATHCITLQHRLR